MTIIATNTFTYGEKEKNVKSYYSNERELHFCSYCGEKAKSKDVGSSHNHRYEEDIRYYCECEDAKEEARLRQEERKLVVHLHGIQDLLRKMEKKTDNPKVRQVKYETELRLLQAKYDIGAK